MEIKQIFKYIAKPRKVINQLKITLEFEWVRGGEELTKYIQDYHTYQESDMYMDDYGGIHIDDNETDGYSEYSLFLVACLGDRLLCIAVIKFLADNVVCYCDRYDRGGWSKLFKIEELNEAKRWCEANVFTKYFETAPI